LFSLIIFGSLCTGDFVWSGECGRTRFWSDIDAIALVRGRSRSRHFERDLNRLATDGEWASALFNIDISVCSVDELANLPNTFQAAEIRHAGFVLDGVDARGYFPAAFEPQFVRQAFLFNLWKGVLFRPDRATGEARRLYLLALARQTLDLPTLAFGEEGRCIFGHNRRVETFLDLSPTHPLATELARECVLLAMNVRCGQEAEPEKLAGHQFELATTAISFLDHQVPPPHAPDRLLVTDVHP
jgi:hypothetical protein